MAVPGAIDRSSVFTYKYSKLSNARSTRVLTLLPGISSDEIRSRLTENLLDELPVFEALSYTWGDPTRSRTISMNGTSFGITETVYTFLKRHRHENESRSLWIDQISIDQSDDNEKTVQVKMMGDIYQSATRVIIWLGNSDDAKLAIDLVKKLTGRFSAIDPFLIAGPIMAFAVSVWTYTIPLLTAEGRDNLDAVLEAAKDNLGKIYAAVPWTTIAWPIMGPWASIRRLGWDATESKDFLAMLQLLRHPWFDRVWVIQETVLAQSATVLYGDEELPWQTLSYFIIALVQSLSGLPKWTSPLTEAETHLMRCSLPISMLHVCQMGEMRNINKLGIKHQFPQLMRRFITCKATCPKDKIFALLALSDEADLDKERLTMWPRLPATINYDRSIPDREVFVSTARNMLLRDCSAFRQPLFVLPFTGTGFGPTNIEGGLPSWVPDWIGRDAAGRKITTLAYHFGGETLSYRSSGQACDVYTYNSTAVREEIARTIIKQPLFALTLCGPRPDVTTSPYVFPGPNALPESLKLDQTVLVDTIANMTSTPLNANVFDNETTYSPSSNKLEDLVDTFKRAGDWQIEAQNIMLLASDPYPTKRPIGRVEAYGRTVIGDRTTTARPAPEKFLSTDGGLFQTLQSIIYARVIGQGLSAELEKEIKYMWPDMWNGDKESEAGKRQMKFWMQKTWVLPYAIALREVCWGRKFAVMERGWMGVVPPGSRVGDQIRIIMGAQTPFVVGPADGFGIAEVRDSAELKCCELVGECYVHGMMDGEAISDCNATSSLWESIVLI